MDQLNKRSYTTLAIAADDAAKENVDVLAGVEDDAIDNTVSSMPVICNCKSFVYTFICFIAPQVQKR